MPLVAGKVQPFFENKYMVDLVNDGEHRDADYFAVLSHKFFIDTVDRELRPITKERIESNLVETDVVSFFGYKRDGNAIFAHAEKVHRGIGDCYRELFRLLGHNYNPSMPMRFVVYRNCFLARSHVYERYVKEILGPCVRLMSDHMNTALWYSIWKDSKYPYAKSRFRQHEGLREKFISDMGVPYYPFHTFVLERMFSYWLNINPEITCKHI